MIQKKETKTSFTQQIEPNVSEIITEENVKNTIEQLEDNSSLIAEPGLEINGVITLISDTLITISSSDDYINKQFNKSKNKSGLKAYIERELCYSPSTLYYRESKGKKESITKEDIKVKDMVRYSFTIAATGDPILYSITVIE